MRRWRVLLVGAALLVSAPLTAQSADGSARQEPEVLGASAAFSDIDSERGRVWLEAGTPIFSTPDAASERIAIVDAESEMEVLERAEPWLKIQHEGRIGWVWPDLPRSERSLDITPLVETIDVETPGFAFADPDRRRELVQQAMALSAPNGRLGPWELFTDVKDRRLIEYLDSIATGLSTSYQERYGLEPAPPNGQSVAVFSTEAAYRPFESEATHLAGLGARGHAGGGLAALFIEDHRLAEAGALLVHELTHLMSRSALGPTPPPWIEEGFANDMAYCRIDRQGRLRPGTINGERVSLGNRRLGVSVQYSGAVAALAELLRLRTRREATPLERLVELDQTSFLDSDGWRQHYIESAFLVRFLLEGEQKRFAPGFASYLGEIGTGVSPDSTQLIELLDTDWARLERGLDAWLRVQAVSLLR